MTSGTLRGLSLVALLIVSGCFRPGIRGVVTDLRGEPLPGVVVQVSGTDRQALTNARGQYRLVSNAGDVTLEFSKSGYAPARLEAQGIARRSRRDLETQLWKLPVNEGVYLLEADRYVPMSWVIPGLFFMADGTVAYGTRSTPQPSTTSTEPMNLCFHTPRYDARLTRLVQAEATQPASKTGAFEVWTAGGTVDADLVPVDKPAGMLRRLRIDRKLEPGAYAIHWGSLEGYATLDSRMFMFEVVAIAMDAAGEASDAEDRDDSQESEDPGGVVSPSEAAESPA